MPRIPAPTEPLTNEHVIVRLSAERDLPEILIAYQDDPQLHVMLGEQRPPSGAQLPTGRSASPKASHPPSSASRYPPTGLSKPSQARMNTSALPPPYVPWYGDDPATGKSVDCVNPLT